MQIDAAITWKMQHPRWNNPPVSNDQDRIRLERLQAFTELGVELDLFWLDDGKAAPECRSFDGSRLHLHSPPSGAVRLRHN